jgi:drug/metabolite transporter (DMT)-like permease
MSHHSQFDNKRRGIVMMLLACLFFSLMDAVMKRLTADYPPLQITAMRALSGLPLIAAYVHWRGAWASLRQVRWPLHLLRTVLGVLMLSLFIFAIKTLPLTEAYSLFYISPFAIAALSIPFLGERVSRASWVAIVVGLIGVLVVLKPSGQGMVSLAGLAILGAALCYAVSAITVRLLSRTDSAESMVFWMLVGVGLLAGSLAAPNWVAVRAEHTGLLIALAITGFIGQLTITEAFRIAPAATVTPFEYSALAWALGLDVLFWQVWPEWRVLTGAGIIVASGVYLARHEANLPEAERP